MDMAGRWVWGVDAGDAKPRHYYAFAAGEVVTLFTSRDGLAMENRIS